MKTGVIIYVLGPGSLKKTIGIEAAESCLGLPVDGMEIVHSMDDNFDLMYAWWSLLVKGMHRIICITAEPVKNNELRLTGRQLRLFG